MTADLNPTQFLEFCTKEKAGLVTLRSISTTKKNGVWRVEYEEVRKVVDTEKKIDKVIVTG